jgi:hypothetical protein
LAAHRLFIVEFGLECADDMVCLASDLFPDASLQGELFPIKEGHQ